MIPVFQYLRGVVEGLFDPEALEKSCFMIGNLLDESIVTDDKKAHDPCREYEFEIVRKGKTLDLSRIDFKNSKRILKRRNIKTSRLLT